MDNRTANANAADLISRARAIHSKVLTPENALLVREILESALEDPVGVDPRRLAEAWSLLAEILMCDYLNRWNHAGLPELARAENAVQRALEIIPELAPAHYASGLIYRAKGKHEASLAAFARTTELNPDIPLAYAQQGAQLMYVGRPKEAVPLVEKAIKLSPVASPALGMFYWIIGRAHFFSGNYEAAIAWLRKSVELRPTLWYNRLYLVSACALAGDGKEAKIALADFDARFPGYTLSRVESDEQTNPNGNPVVVEGRRKFHEGLQQAGMTAG